MLSKYIPFTNVTCLTFAVVCFSIAILSQSTFATESTSIPNIVYFLVDDMGYADAGFNGGKDFRTPNMDALAKSGAVLTDFYVQPVCSPTRSALLTGRYPTHTGVYSIVGPTDKWGLGLDERLLPQALKESDYTTAICGKWHLGKFEPDYLPTHRGFDHQYGCWGGALSYNDHVRMKAIDWYRQDEPSSDEGYTTHLIAKESCRIIDEQPAGKPLFLYVPFNAVHSPYQVPENYKQPYTSLSKTRQTMGGLLATVDEAIGQVVAALDKKGIRDNTLIIFSSDNGGVFPGKYTDNGPLRAGKGTIYEGGVRVCAFATWPGRIPAGVRIKEPIHIIDWYPTLLKLVGGSLTQKLHIDGKDIWPVLTQNAQSPHDELLLIGSKPGMAALRVGDWKLLRNASSKDAEESNEDASPTEVTTELYNLADDISEQHNLASSQPEKVMLLNARLDRLFKDAAPSGDTKQNVNGTKGAAKKSKSKGKIDE